MAQTPKTPEEICCIAIQVQLASCMNELDDADPPVLVDENTRATNAAVGINGVLSDYTHDAITDADLKTKILATNYHYITDLANQIVADQNVVFV